VELASLHIHNTYVQDGKLALELAVLEKRRCSKDQHAARGNHGEVVGVLIGAGMAAGQDVNACLGRVISVYGCMGAWVLLQVSVGSEGGISLDLI
jgi:hypothetical protein